MCSFRMNSEMLMNSLGLRVIFFVIGWISIAKSDASPVDIKLGVLIPAVSTKEDIPPKSRALTAIQIGLEKVRREGVVSGINFTVNYRDSNCSGTWAPLHAMDMYYKNESHVFFGPLCTFATSAVARYSPYWGIPVITPGARAEGFKDKEEFRLLTRMTGSYSNTADVVYTILKYFSWKLAGIILHNNLVVPELGDADSYFLCKPVFTVLKRTGPRVWYSQIDQNYMDKYNLGNILREASRNCRIVVLCASADSVREIMIKAHELNFDNGEYVFLNIDLFSSKEDSEKPWYRENDTTERNQKAKKAYEALMTVTLRKPTSPEYRNFSEEVKKRAGNDSFAYGEDEVNSFVGAFHDAVILYALALNETLANNRSITNGTEITHRMWNRTFEGITGTVSIDSNGDRNADYSLLDMDPHTGKFEVVANYFGKDKKYVPVSNTEIHWAGNRKSAPPDTPKCGFDGAKCPPEKPFPEYGIVIIVLGSLLVIVVIAAFFIYRHIKLEAELAEMNWRVRWDDIMFGTMENDRKMRRQGSNLSLTRTTNGEACAEGRVLIERSDKHELDWCQCGQCEATDAPAKRVCCRQLELYGIFQEGGTCITSNKEFREVVLNRDVLVAVFIHVMLIKRQRGVAPVNLNGCKLRLMATRQFLCWMHKGQRLKKEIRMAVPSCVSRAIRMEFPDDTNENSGGSLTDTSMTGVIPLENVA